jgi:hypothetical protein
MTLRMEDASVARLKVPWLGEILRMPQDDHVARGVLSLGTDPLPPAQDYRLGEGIAEISGVRPRPEL